MGQFAHGKPNGEGQRNDDSGNQFSGHFVDGQLEGNGTFNSADGDIYVGQFKQNQLNGKGRYENADGDVDRPVQGRRPERQGRIDWRGR